MNNELFQQLSELNMFYRIYLKLTDAISDCNETIEYHEQKYRELKNRKSGQGNLNIMAKLGAIPCVLIAIVFGVISLVCLSMGAFQGESQSLILLLLSLPIVAVFAFLSFWLLVVIPKKCKATEEQENKAYEKEADEYWQTEGGPEVAQNKKMLAELEAKRAELEREGIHLADFLPSEYTNSTTVAYLLNYVATGRAETLKEALNLFEEQKFRWKMESMQAEIIEQNNRMAEYAEESARQQAQIANRVDDIYWQQMYEYYEKLSK